MAENKIDDTVEFLQDDPVAEKAEKIGRELGAEKMSQGGKEELPDYEIEEEDDNREDERIAKTREKVEASAAAKEGRKVLSNKEKRDLRKKRVKEKFTAKDAAIAERDEKIALLESRLNNVEGQMTNSDKAKIAEAISQTESVYLQAERDHADAFAESDGQKATRAMKVMYEAQRRIEQLSNVRDKFNQQAAPAQRTPANNQPKAAVISKGQEWMSRHDWYNPNGSDEDSEIAKSISGVLANEGFDPSTDDFWDELDDRLQARGIGKAIDEAEEIEEEEEAPKAKPVARRRPPMGGGGGQRQDVQGKTKVTLPKAYVQALKDNGKWDDPVVRARMVKRFLDTQKQNQAG